MAIIGLALFLSFESNASDVGCDHSKKVRVELTQEAMHERARSCLLAYNRLPRVIKESRVKGGNNLVEHFKKYRGEYTEYDRACFKKWCDLRGRTRNFLADTAGVLFRKVGSSYRFVCSAFRIRSDILITARHCIYHSQGKKLNFRQLVFRLIGDPQRDIKVIDEIANKNPTAYRLTVADDLNDYWYLKLDPTAPVLKKSQSSFRKGVDFGTWLGIVGLNAAAYVLDTQQTHSSWTDALRWSELPGSQRFYVESLPHKPPSKDAEQECIYHQSPTYSGMSGAAIVSGDVSNKNAPPTLFIGGIHLRSGDVDSSEKSQATCGEFRDFNVGLSLPEHVNGNFGTPN